MLGAITTVQNRAQVPTRRTLVDQKGLGKPPLFSGKEEDVYVWAKKLRTTCQVFPNVRGALSVAVESHDVVTAAAVALGVLELDAETSAEMDGQLFIVLSALTDCESFHVVTSAGGSRLRERAQVSQQVGAVQGRARSLLREILSPPRAKLPELMGAIERMEDLVRRYCGRGDASRKRALSCGRHCMSSLEALLPYDLEKHVQLYRARLTSYVVVREENKT